MEPRSQNLKVVRLVGLTSKSFVRDAYRREPALEFHDALVQQKFFFDNDSVFNDYFDIRLRELGFESQSVVHDVDEIRNAWMRNSNVELSGDADLDFIVAVVNRFGANVVFEQTAGILNSHRVRKLKMICPGVKLVAAHIAALVDYSAYSEHDLVFVGCESYILPMEEAGCGTVILLRHGFDTRLIEKYESPQRSYDVTFVGNSGFRNPSYWSRYKYLDQLSDAGLLQSWSKPDLASSECQRRVRGFVEQSKFGAVLFNCLKVMIGLVSSGFLRLVGSSQITKFFGDSIATRLIKSSSAYRLSREVSFPFGWRFPQIPFYLRDYENSHSQVFGSEMLRVLAKSKITFHRRADLVDGCAGAMRLFEATGMGAMLLTDEDSDIGLVFEPGVEVVTYSSYEDCVEKIRYFLEHESERELIAAKGQERTMNEHSLNARYSFIAEQLLKQLQNG
jgi:spore maturation protein CgeB